jgi:hypothetical protein
MNNPNDLLALLDAIGRSLQALPHTLALIGLGSVGLETDRLDAYSDLDFFAIVEEGYKPDFLSNLGWLEQVCPVAYAFANTRDGYKLLFVDGIFCEFAVFAPPELQSIPFAPGRIIWKRPEVPEAIRLPNLQSAPPAQSETAWLVGEALTNLYVGLGRFRRGEKLSAQRFIQHYAVDHLLKLAVQLESETRASIDPYALERRCEQRLPAFAAHLPGFVQGYERSPESAAAILAFLEQHFDVHPDMAAAIRRLANPDPR